MAIARSLRRYLRARNIDYEITRHPASPSASRSAQAAHVAGERVAKSVVLHDDDGYVVAVVPSTHRLEFGTLRKLLDRRLDLAAEDELAALFGDCDIGAIPAVSAAYGLEAVVDESLAAQPDIYFEGGDHRSLVHVSGENFDRLMQGAKRGQFSHHV